MTERVYTEVEIAEVRKFAQRRYWKMSDRVRNYPRYRGVELSCTKNEFIEFALKCDSLYSLFRAWHESGKILRLKPTVDRIDGDKGYSIDNIQFLTYGDNSAKGTTERKYQAAIGRARKRAADRAASRPPKPLSAYYENKQNARRKLNLEQVIEIRRGLQTGESTKLMALKYRISESLIERIGARKEWNYEGV